MSTRWMMALLALGMWSAALAAQRPNFVFVQFEGTGGGWASTSVAMDDRLPDAKASAALTPHLAKLAAQGARCAEFYVSAPRCTPARATFLTGIGAAKLGMTYVNEGGAERAPRDRQEGGRGRLRQEPAAGARRVIPPSSRADLADDVVTIGELLRGAGYATAHFGKWHVGRTPPGAHGFDEHDGANTNQGPERGVKPNPEQAQVITDKGLAFAKRARAAGKPFYLQLSHYGGGSEEETRPETRQALAAELRQTRGKGSWQALILADIDREVGRLLAALDDAQLAAQTYVVVSFDHGASGRDANAPLRGGKGSVYEGGIRVPFLVRGPGVPAGVCLHARASAADLLPTLAEWAGVDDVPAAVEGASLAKLLTGKAQTVARARPEFVVHFPHYDLGSPPAAALFLGDYKLVRNLEDGRRELYDLRRDPGERRDLAAALQDQVADLDRRLDAYLTSIGAALPKPNPAFGK